MYNWLIKFADVGIRTTDLWCRWQPLYQLSHHHSHWHPILTLSYSNVVCLSVFEWEPLYLTVQGAQTFHLMDSTIVKYVHKIHSWAFQLRKLNSHTCRGIQSWTQLLFFDQGCQLSTLPVVVALKCTNLLIKRSWVWIPFMFWSFSLSVFKKCSWSRSLLEVSDFL